MNETDTRKKAVVIVDGLSSGAYLAPRFKARGIPCIHIMSHAVYPDGIQSMIPTNLIATESPYIENLVFEGDFGTILQALGRYSILGVIPGMELAVPFADALSECMGLPSNGTRGSLTRRNKFLMQCALRHAGVPTKEFLCTENEDEVLAWYRSRKYPEIVIKPMKSAGTDGVRFCKSEDDIRQAVRALLGTKGLLGEENTAILAEERLFGTEFGVNTVSWDGKHRLAELWQYHKVPVEGAGNVYDCTRLHDWPDETLMPLVRYAFRVLNVLGIRYGAAHTEIMLTEKGPLLVESGARVMGGNIPPDLILQCAGQCQIDLTVQAYRDPDTFLTEVDKPYKLRRHLIRKHLIAGCEGAPSGEISAIDHLAELPSCVRGDFVHLIDDWYVSRTVDMVTSPAKVFLMHEDPNVILSDYRVIRQYEQNHEQAFYNLGMPETECRM
ncbi:MAG: ATP-grasp domain-containing protein [Methanoregulaceae archaeon]